MSATPQTIVNEQIWQQHLMLYLDSVLLDFDNDEEILKLKLKLKNSQLTLEEKAKK